MVTETKNRRSPGFSHPHVAFGEKGEWYIYWAKLG